jgi:hypothetical protein
MKSIKTLTILLAVAVLGLIGLGIGFWQQGEQSKAQIADLRAESAQKLADLAAAHQQTLVVKQTQHEEAIKALTEDFEKKVDGLRSDQRKQMATAFKEFEAIFDGNKRTIDYIDALESRVKAGQGVSKAEVEKLAVIATGISFLQKEYRKPFQEFSELETFFAKQTGTSAEKPQSSFGFFKRMFSKEFREAEKDYYRSEGAREAYTEAQSKFSSVYASAQKQMAAVGLNGDAQVKKLYALIEEKQGANAEDLSQAARAGIAVMRTRSSQDNILSSASAQDPADGATSGSTAAAAVPACKGRMSPARI